MNIALLGMGTVGSGVYALLQGRTDLRIRRILDRRTLPAPAEALRTEDYADILSDPAIDTVVELLGGVEPAHGMALAALKAGKHVVSANKLMLSADFASLLRAASASGAQLRISASAGGGIPWLTNVLRVRRLGRIDSVAGIYNGTTNFILDAMQRQGIQYSEALAQAQALGYAEADPSADVDGWDARSKLVLSGSIAFDALLDPEKIPTRGIRGITAADIAFFQSRGWVCRLIAHAERNGDAVSAVVEPMLVPETAREASVYGCDNCFSLTAPDVGTLSFLGPGAGREPTAFQVVNDLFDIDSGAPAPVYVADPRPAAVDAERLKRRYYVRAAGPLPFAAEAVGDGVRITEPVSCAAMHRAATVDFFAALSHSI